uniref:Tumor necrosis factor receptor superfamily member 11B n=1 Tax=Fundulus heteroclitus TaxID=8078 RepID=A0A3Q2T8Y7_FUNHE
MICSLFLTELFLLLSVRSWLAHGTTAPPTYEHTDPLTGTTVQCDRCPPGTFLRASCSSDTKSDCAPCPEGSFTELWNYIGHCLRCGICGRNQVVKKECSADSDRQCECKQGYFYRQDYDMCVRHSECPSGHGVLTRGTAETDTVCRICSDGTFSDISSADHNCTQHQSCGNAGMKLVLKGTIWHDNVCAKVKDGAAYLREIIPAFFIHHKIKIKRLRRIVHKLLPDDVRKQEGTSELSFSELHSRISSWVSSATPMQIRQLPAILIKMRASHAGEKLQNILNAIDKNLSKECHNGC